MSELPDMINRHRRKLLGEILVEDRFITKTILDEALHNRADASPRMIGDFLIDMGYVSSEAVTIALAKQNGLAYVDLKEYEINPEARDIISEEAARRSNIVPIDKTGSTVTVAISDPGNTVLLDYIRLKTRLNPIPVMASPQEITEAIDRLYAENQDGGATLEQLIRDVSTDEVEVIESRNSDDEGEGAGDADDAPIIRLVNKIISEAVRMRASDIHLEPKEKRLDLRYRVDGVLQRMPAPPKRFQNAIISRLKIMGDCNIAERRRPQDGRFKIRTGNKAVDFRLSILPTVHGEKVVLRLLDQGASAPKIADIGFEPEQRAAFERAIRQPNGIVLLTGPTGSGKSTTLYAALSVVATSDKNVITVENPVEYQIDSINQVQIHPEIGLTFSEGLRTILRQDPDIIMVGEMRDEETADIAIKASITGHLVLSTLHTNDAPGAITRLIDMGIQPYLVTSSLNLVVAQRLVRRVCVRCAVPAVPEAETLDRLGMAPADRERARFMKGRGCDQCNKSGYRGRSAIHEVLEMDDDVRQMVIDGRHASDISIHLRRQGVLSLRQSGIRKIMAGLTTPEEVLANTASEPRSTTPLQVPPSAFDPAKDLSNPA